MSSPETKNLYFDAKNGITSSLGEGSATSFSQIVDKRVAKHPTYTVRKWILDVDHLPHPTCMKVLNIKKLLNKKLYWQFLKYITFVYYFSYIRVWFEPKPGCNWNSSQNYYHLGHKKRPSLCKNLSIFMTFQCFKKFLKIWKKGQIKCSWLRLCITFYDQYFSRSEFLNY